MGLLDDAIKEHLELKRQHGADPSEVARQEREALGAPRTPTAPRDDAPPAQDAELDLERSSPAAPPPEPDAIPEPPVAADPSPTPTDERRGAVSSDRFAADADEDDLDWSDPRPSPADEADAAPPAADADEDVLEETPEFLQETPEHDRLWFEQRPPRDFDF